MYIVHYTFAAINNSEQKKIMVLKIYFVAQKETLYFKERKKAYVGISLTWLNRYYRHDPFFNNRYFCIEIVSCYIVATAAAADAGATIQEAVYLFTEFVLRNVKLHYTRATRLRGVAYTHGELRSTPRELPTMASFQTQRCIAKPRDDVSCLHW